MPDEFRGDYTPTSDIFGKFIEGLKMGQSLRKEKEDRAVKSAELQMKAMTDNLAREKWNQEIWQKSGGNLQAKELDAAYRMISQTEGAEVPTGSLPEPSTATPGGATTFSVAQGLGIPARPAWKLSDESIRGVIPAISPNANIGYKQYEADPTVQTQKSNEALANISGANQAIQDRQRAGLEQLGTNYVKIGQDPNTGVDIYGSPTGRPVFGPQKPAPRVSGGADAGTLTPAGIKFAALAYLKTGQMPNVGMGAAGNRTKIINMAAELSKTTDGQVSVSKMIENAMQNKANSMAYAQLQKQADSITTFEETATLNADNAISAAEKIGRTGIPIFNAWMNAGRKSITGNPDITAFNLAVRTFVNEYARITTSVTGGGVTSDTARKEVEDLITTAQTPAQFINALNMAKSDMENRVTAYATQFERIRERSNNLNETPGTDKGTEKKPKKMW